jgi:hypothetical protein
MTMLRAVARPMLASMFAPGGPATFAEHAFWRESDPQARAEHRVHFFKNVSMTGGLLMAAMDRRSSKPMPKQRSDTKAAD